MCYLRYLQFVLKEELAFRKSLLFKKIVIFVPKIEHYKQNNDMQKLLSLPPNLVEAFPDLAHVNTDEWFCTSDPVGMKLGSGGGTTWLRRQWEQNRSAEARAEKRILFHAGGQSRRLPSYAPSGKILTPLPVFRWERGQQ